VARDRDGPGERRQQAEQGAQQRGLAAAVGAEQRQHLATRDRARTLTPVEVPLGVLTALVGTPLFLVLLVRADRDWQ
jgi:ABC-type cobalamin transport system permease subunit